MKRIIILMLKTYKAAISPYMPGVCRFFPSCSDYAQEAIQRHGAVKGAALTARRLARCHPLQEGGYDPVPEA